MKATMKTPGRQRGDHLIHRLAVRDRTTCDARTNLNGRIFSFHSSESYLGELAARMFALLLWPSPLTFLDTTGVAHASRVWCLASFLTLNFSRSGVEAADSLRRTRGTSMKENVFRPTRIGG